MPADLPVTNVIRSVARYTVQGQFAHVVFHHLISATPVVADCQDCATEVGNALKNRFGPLQSNNAELLDVTSQDLTAGSSLGHTSIINNVGAVGDEPLALQAAGLLSWLIGSFYRGGKPRTYMPGVPDESVPDGRSFSSGALTSWSTAASDFFGDISTLTLTSGHTARLVVVHRFSGHAQLTPPTTEFITDVRMNSIIATQRRRLNRG